MKKYLQLGAEGRSNGGYYRSQLKKDVLYAYFRYNDVDLAISKADGKAVRMEDALVDRLLKDGKITPEVRQAYVSRVLAVCSDHEKYDHVPVEEIYRDICAVRAEMLPDGVLEEAWSAAAAQPEMFDTADGIDQSRKKEALLDNSGAVIFALYQPELMQLFQKDLHKALDGKKDVYLLVGSGKGAVLPTKQLLEAWIDAPVTFLEAEDDRVAWNETLHRHLQENRACLLAYGEESLIQCRALVLDAVVSATPRGFYGQAVTNQLGIPRGCVVYVPRGLDITRWVRLTEQTRLSYWHLAKLWEKFGDAIYGYTPEQLYSRYPQFFLNIYENGGKCMEAEPDYPIRLEVPENATLEEYDACRDQAIKRYLDGFENITYHSAYFDEAMVRRPICRDSRQPQKGILVQGVRVKKAEGACIMQCDKGSTLRQKFAREESRETAIISNFLFFLTPKLGRLYNELRKDRPLEQADAAAGHLDYMLCYRDGKRVETFPLFRKTCIAMKENGEFLFFNYRLGGGSVCVGEHPLRWEKADVDSRDSQAPVQVFTPYYSVADQDADRQTYRALVGQDRINLVILQDKLCALRRGEVVLPSVGVTVSLSRELGEQLLEALALPALEDGYYDVSGLELTVQLDGPEQISKEQWAQVQWAYGGGLSLILDGVGLCDGDHMEQWFCQDGWTSPLSRQTQESNLHSLAKHPRTAIGTTRNGELVILVFSGRTWRSSGADYREMIQIARELIPDIHYLMNVDGGGSAMLGMACGGRFMELSCPSTSAGSTVGMVRPINTVLYIPAGEQKKK